MYSYLDKKQVAALGCNSSPFMGRWPEGPEGLRRLEVVQKHTPAHLWGGGPKGRRGCAAWKLSRSTLLPIYGEVARRAGGVACSAAPIAPAQIPSSPHTTPMRATSVTWTRR